MYVQFYSRQFDKIIGNMKKIVLLLFKAHKYTGIIISGFFLMWFVTGVILIYHPYPKLSESEYNSMKETLPTSLPELA